ncbi:MAG: DUF6338 family protein [Gammaproteobacteria bacterium]|nr:DUF6338 family protein [Gammaproteobacteria bacterium]
MPGLNLFDNPYTTVGLLVPGLIVLSVRSQFLTGRRPPHSAALLSYLTVSVIYYALALPFVHFILSFQEAGNSKVLLTWFALIFIGPALLGLLLGVNIQKDLFRRALKYCGLNPIHVIPTAWDWKFGNMTEQWVLVTLKDGTRFAGFCGDESFMSSDPSERDIYIQWTYDIDDQNKWSSRGESGVLIAAAEVQTIEFWPYNPQEEANEQE